MFRNISINIARVIKWLIFSTAFIPLTFSSKFLYPHITPKVFFAKGVIQIALAFALILFLWLLFFEKIRLKEIGTNFISHLRSSTFARFLLIFGGIYVFSQILSTIFAEFPYRAFWGTLERGEGLFNFLHFVVFFALTVVFFGKKDFERYFKFSLVVGLIVYFYAILQALKFTQFPFTFAPDPRPGSFLGNGAFLAAYSFFVMISAVITFWFSKRLITADEKPITTDMSQRSQKFWFYLSIAALVLSPIIIFLTRTRGALVGLGASIFVLLVYFALFGRPMPEERRVSIISRPRLFAIFALAALIVFGATLFLTRDAAMWQKIPGLDRVAYTLSSFGTEPSTQVRLLGWKLAVRAFFEKPIFGWGPEHYLRVFETQYDPKFSAYGEVWLDRAHNGVLDVAATQGALGLVGYIGFLAGTLWFFFGKMQIVVNPLHRNLPPRLDETGSEESKIRLWVGIIFFGFITQNFFLLEEFHTYAPFFAMVAAIVAGVFSGNKESENVSMWGGSTSLRRLNLQKLIPLLGLSVLVLVVTSFVIYKTVLPPAIQAYYAHKIETSQDKEELLSFWNKATKPYNFAQYSIRPYLHDFFYANQSAVFTDSRLADLGNRFIDSIREVIERDGPYDIRLHIRLGQAHQEMAKGDLSSEDSLAHYRAGEDVLKEGLKISPLNQELVYALAFALVGQKRYGEAIKVIEEGIMLNPGSSKISRLHYYHGLILAAAGRSNEAIQAFEDMRRADPQLTRFFPNDIKGLFSVYESLGEYDRIIDIVTESARGYIQAKIDLQYYEIALPYYIYQRNGEGVVVVAKFIAKKFPERKNDMEAIIELAEKGEWDILKSL